MSLVLRGSGFGVRNLVENERSQSRKERSGYTILRSLGMHDDHLGSN